MTVAVAVAVTVPRDTYPTASLNLTATPDFTDLSKWRLKVEHGAQTWHYLDSEQELREWPQTAADRYHLGLSFSSQTFASPKDPLSAARNGYEYYKHLQTEDGHWAGEYGGPMFLLPGLIIVHYITSTPVPEHFRLEIIRYLLKRVNPDDGGWGIHIEGCSTLFGTGLNYVVLRILGFSAEHPVMRRARAFLHHHGGCTGIPSWGKFWLAALGVYGWDGVNSIPPELWVLPTWLPIHPSRWWVHTRMVYLPMGYIYARRLSAPLTTFTEDLRSELYVEPYESIDWSDQCNNIAEIDAFYPHTNLMEFLYGILAIYEKFGGIKPLRDHSIDLAYKYVSMEDENTFFLDIGPVNKALNWLVVFYHNGRDSFEFKEHVKRNADFMWMGPEGMMMNGTNGSQLWDTAFVTQAIYESGLSDEPQNHDSVVRALEFLDDCQIKRNVPEREKCFRDATKGAWPFSTRDQGYTVSDCTAEGLKSTIYLQTLSYTPKLVPKERLQDAVDVLLRMQNSDGGFASYEAIRGPKWLEWLNPAEVFGDIMIEYSYPECTTAVLLGLTTFRKFYPDYRVNEIAAVAEKAVRYIKNAQRPDGSWFGSWAICFTYATLFALESLASVGESYDNSPDVKRACEFLIGKQRSDGGWGESYKSCETGVYVEHANTQVVNTAWALLSLMAAKYPNEEPIRRGIQLIMKRQLPNGEWPQEAIEGVFNRNCMISYPNYKFAFTIWALGRYAKRFGNPVVA